jgi:hypothetical protein
MHRVAQLSEMFCQRPKKGETTSDAFVLPGSVGCPNTALVVLLYAPIAPIAQDSDRIDL